MKVERIYTQNIKIEGNSNKCCRRKIKEGELCNLTGTPSVLKYKSFDLLAYNSKFFDRIFNIIIFEIFVF